MPKYSLSSLNAVPRLLGLREVVEVSRRVSPLLKKFVIPHRDGQGRVLWWRILRKKDETLKELFLLTTRSCIFAYIQVKNAFCVRKRHELTLTPPPVRGSARNGPGGYALGLPSESRKMLIFLRHPAIFCSPPYFDNWKGCQNSLQLFWRVSAAGSEDTGGGVGGYSRRSWWVPAAGSEGCSSMFRGYSQPFFGSSATKFWNTFLGRNKLDSKAWNWF